MTLLPKYGFSFLACFLLLTPVIFSQITGTVIDSESNQALVQVSVLNESTNKGVFTDSTGVFSIDASIGDVLRVYYLGYKSQKVSIDTVRPLIIKLVLGISLDEVVITGYSVDSRRKIPGSVSTVKARDLQIAPSSNVEQMLQGRVPGLTLITNGQPGTASQVRVRGYGALAGNEPLYVVDGVPVSSVDFLQPGDIETVTVLKDATAASIYGARAAGGVIVFSTNKGRKGNQKLRITYDGMTGVTTPGSGPAIMSPQDQAEWTWKAIRNAATLSGLNPTFNHPQYGSGSTPILPDYLLVGTASGVRGTIDLNDHVDLYNINLDAGPIYQVVKANHAGTDWYDVVTRNALINRHHLGISGSGEKSQYYLGFGFQDQEGIVKHQKFSRYSFRANTAFDLLPFLRVGENLQLTYRSTRILFGSNGGLGSAVEGNVIRSSSRVNPILPVYDEFGGYAGTAAPGVGISGNPLARTNNLQDDRNFSAQAFGNIYLELEPIKDLVFRTSLGGQFVSVNSRRYGKKSYHNAQKVTTATFSQFASYTTQWVWTNTLQYQKKIGLHNVDLLAGQEALDQGSGYDINGFGVDPISQNINYVGLSTVSSRVVEGSPFNGVRFSSYFTRLNYDFDDKYLFSFILRRDGSSRFGSNNRYGIFPAFSAAWRLSSENFMQGINFLDDLKIRGGYGIMGNSNNVDPNNQFSLYGTNLNAASYDLSGTNTQAMPGFYRTRIGNPTARWEQAITANIGVDALFFNGRLDIGVELWRKETNNLLFQLPVTVQTGFFAEAPFVNVGKILNEGIDFILTTKGKVNAFNYQISLNGGFLHNEIIELSPGLENIPNQSISIDGITPVLNQVGEPLSAFYGYEVQGIFRDQEEVSIAAEQDGAAPGRFRYKDINEDGVIDQQDRTNLGNPIADFTGGLSLKIAWQNFELELYSFASIGNEIYNLNKRISDFYPFGIDGAFSERVKDSWTFEDPDASIPIFENTSNFSTNTQSNSYYVENGSYFRMQNITLSYLLPASIISKWKRERLRLYASTNNVFTITQYSGLDPSVAGATDTNFGIDFGNFPITRSWIFGVSMSF